MNQTFKKGTNFYCPTWEALHSSDTNMDTAAALRCLLLTIAQCGCPLGGSTSNYPNQMWMFATKRGALNPNRKNISWLGHLVIPGARTPMKECTWRDSWLQLYTNQRMGLSDISVSWDPCSCRSVCRFRSHQVGAGYWMQDYTPLGKMGGDSIYGKDVFEG